ncbi:DUF4102 domain-containing protein [Altererythrobacter sp. FM1]|uniref:Arm DNA-binding domain-containing protein n=1 Tax=Tsuneonella flava TaxID=2055955 RepID=UPI000C803FC7|nr:DUF4102 domain-containing protein [Altererythrobacter sp. FM1]
MLTDKAVRAAAAKDKAYNLTGSRGLHLHVTASGHKRWRYKYRLEKKERLLTLGAYSEVSLADAREIRDDAKKILREPPPAWRQARTPDRERRFGKVFRRGSSRMACASERTLEASSRKRCDYQPGERCLSR